MLYINIGYKKVSRRQIKNGGGIKWNKGKLDDGTYYWSEDGAEPYHFVFEDPWVRGKLDNGKPFWSERANPSNIVFIHPELKGFCPKVIIITGSPLVNGVDINGIYKHTGYNSLYPTYFHTTNRDLGIFYCDGSDPDWCQLMNDEKKTEWQLYSGETDPYTPLAYILADQGGIADCLLSDPVWKVKKGDTTVAEPSIKTLFGCSDEEKDPKCDFAKSRLNGGKRSLIKQIRKRRYSRKQLRKSYKRYNL